MATAQMGFNQDIFPLQEGKERLLKVKANSPGFFFPHFKCFQGVFNAIFSVSVGYLSLQSAPWCTADVSFFRLISKPVPEHGESRQTSSPSFLLVYSSVKTAVKFFLFYTIPALYSKTVHWKQTRVSKHWLYFILLSFTCQISELIQFQFPLSYWGMCLGENEYRFLGIREMYIIFSPNKSKLRKRTLLSL